MPSASRPGCSPASRLLPWLVLVGCVALGSGLSSPRTATAQATWDYSPYRIHCWIAVEPTGTLSPRLVEHLRETLVDRADQAAGATWDLRPRLAPTPEIGADLLNALDRVSYEDVRRAVGTPEDDEHALASDKLMLVAVSDEDTGFRIAVRELDLHTRTWSNVVVRSTPQRSVLGELAFDALLAAFRPLCRVEKAERRSAVVRVRAGGLIRSPDCVSRVDAGDLMLAVIRTNDRSGEPREFNGIRVADWTYLVAKERQDTLIDCQIHTAYSQPLGSRRGSRIQRYGLVVRAPRTESTVVLQTFDDPPKPLAGYTVYARHPENEQDVELLGVTDWRGMIAVSQRPDDDTPLRLLYVRNGGMLIVRLPILPGLMPTLSAQMRDDRKRLQFEAYVKSIEAQIRNVVVRREILAARIRKRLEAGKADEAETLLEELRRMPTAAQMVDELDAQKGRVGETDRRSQMHIDSLATKTRELILKYLTDELEKQVTQEFSQRQAGSSGNSGG